MELTFSFHSFSGSGNGGIRFCSSFGDGNGI
jgi:hypothetical protein